MRITGMMLVMMMLSSAVAAQQMNPVHWSFQAKKVSEMEYDIILTAQVDKGWFIYSQYLESDEGPVPTSFTFEENDGFELVGEAKENGHKKEGFDDIFGMNLIKFSDEVTFTQRVKLKNKIDMIHCSVDFMTCDDERCLPPTTVAFEIKL